PPPSMACSSIAGLPDARPSVHAACRNAETPRSANALGTPCTLRCAAFWGRHRADQPVALGRGGGAEIAIAGELRQLLLLALEHAAQRRLEPALDRLLAGLAVEVDAKHVVGGRLVGQLRHRIGPAVP